MKIHTPPFILGRIANAPDDRVLLGWRYRRHRFLAPLQVAQVRFDKTASALQVGSVPASCTASARRHFLFFSLSLWLSLLCGVALIWNGALNTVAAATPRDASAGRKGGCASSGRERCSDGPVSVTRPSLKGPRTTMLATLQARPINHARTELRRRVRSMETRWNARHTLPDNPQIRILLPCSRDRKISYKTSSIPRAQGPY